MKSIFRSKIVAVADLFSIFLFAIPPHAHAVSNGQVDFHLTGKLPTDSFGAVLDLEYRDCEDRQAKVSMREDKDWHGAWEPARISWSQGPTCTVTARVDTFRNGIGYTGIGTCSVTSDAIAQCDIPVCKMVENAAPECP
jgi:hypothetical protein